MVKEDPETPVLISNAEVLEILQKNLAERTTQRRSHQHRDWIEAQVVEYLQSTPCVRVDPERRKELQSILQSSKKVMAGTTVKTTGFALTEAESLQIVNSMPTEPVEIHLLVEELQSRMTERQQEELLAVIGSYIQKEPAGSGKAKSNEKADGEETNVKEEEMPVEM